MLRLVEVALLLAPIALYGLSLYAGYRISAPVAWSVTAALTLAAAATVYFGLKRGLATTEIYVPAHMENGHIVQGRGVFR